MNNTMAKHEKWTLNQCKTEAKKFKSRTAFRVQSASAYNVAYKNGWLDECCSHMTPKKQTDGYWTRNQCASVAKKCTTRTEFNEKYSSAYTAAHRNNWLDEICGHMLRQGNLSERMVYAFEFSDGHAYIGLTWKPDERYSSHLKEGPVFRHIRDDCSKYEFKVVSEYVDQETAARIEDKTIASYKSNGWKILNRRKAGALGGARRNWSKKRCAEVVALCKNRGEIKEKYPGAYSAMQRQQWLGELLAHMPRKIPSKIIRKTPLIPKWTFEKCETEAKKYKFRSDFRSGAPNAYRAAQKNGWLNDICTHMIKRKPNPIKWTKAKCQEAALQCQTKKEFKQKYSGAHYAATKNRWLNELCSHMKSVRNPSGYWTKEKCRDEAKKYDTRREFQEKSNVAYNKAYQNKWLDDICTHMHQTRKPAGYWTKEKCHEEALKYKTRGEFQKKANTVYRRAHSNTWLDDICAHMINIRKPNDYWTKEKCHEIALQFKEKKDFRSSAGNVYAAAHRGGWIDEICSHMQPHRKPAGYWTKERCITEATKFSARSEFRKKSGGAALVADGYGWFDEIWKRTHPEE